MSVLRTRQDALIHRARKDAMARWKFWWDQNASQWCIQRADNVGGIVTAESLVLQEVEADSHGRFMVVYAELVTNTHVMHISEALVRCRRAILRVARVYDQVVRVDPVSMRGDIGI